MKQEMIEAAAFKAAGLTAGGLTLGSLFVDGTALPFFNVPISTLGMAALGSIFGFAYGTPIRPASKVILLGVGGTFIGIWAALIIPQWQAWKWYDKSIMEGAIAGAAALISRFAMPVIIDLIGSLFSKFTTKSGDK